MLHRTFPEIKVSSSTLRRVYIKHKITYKQVKRVKPELDLLAGRYFNLSLEMLRAVDEAGTRKLKIIFLDEAVFTFNTFQGRAWSPSKKGISVSEKSL